MTLTPLQAWDSMLAGNERFIAGEPRHPHQDVAHRRELANGQHPVATIFGCSDSRLAAEIIFDLGLGDSFVVRNAGQIVSDSVVGSIEFAVAELQVPLIVVLGHDSCGAVRAAIDSQAPGAPVLPRHLGDLIAPIVPCVHEVAGTTPGTEVDAAAVDPAEVGRRHVRRTIAGILESSEVISAAVADGTLAIVGANYRLAEGRVVADAAVGLEARPAG